MSFTRRRSAIPVQEMDKLRDLYDALMDARRDEGHEAVPFHKFASLVREQVTHAAGPASG